MMQAISWTVERDDHSDFVLLWWPRGDLYCRRNYERLSSKNFYDAVQEAKYFLNIE
jgi:hypothetical protein